MNDKFFEAIRIIFGILAIIMLLIGIVMILMKIFDYSPDDLSVIMWAGGIMVALLVLIIGVLFNIKGDVGGLKEFKLNVKEGFTRVREDINGLKTNTKEINDKLLRIENKLPKR